MRATITTMRFFERYVGKIFFTGGSCLMALLFLKFFVLNVGQINGPSMEPTFVDDDTFFINKVVYMLHAPERYDVVQVVDPAQEKLLLKRVIGLPGDIVVIKRGKVFLQKFGEAQEHELAEPYLKKSTYTTVLGQKDAKRYAVGKGEYFILGDNRPRSGDSRVYGPVERSRILGKVTGRF